MNLSYTSFHIFLIILCTNGGDTDKGKCDRNVGVGVIEYMCPPSPNGSKTCIHVYQTQLTIACNNTEVLDDEILPTGSHKSITKLTLTKCPIPKNGFKHLVNRFNITKLKALRYNFANTFKHTMKNEDLVGLTDLQTLELYENNISNLNGTIFKNTPNLSELLLNRNAIELNEDLFDNVPNLIYLSLYSNNISSIPRNTFNRLSNLDRLELWNNKIQRLESGVFNDLVNLDMLELSRNEIQVIEEDVFRNLSKLRVINLDCNQLKQISRKMFMNSKNIEIMGMGNNPNVILIDDVFSEFVNLDILNLAHNLLKNISGTLFKGSVKLRVLKLNHNEFKSFEKNVFEGLENLEELQLHNNKIESLHADIFASLKNLKKLHLQNNLINRIEETLLRNLVNLNEINLSDNKIISVHPDILKNNKNLEKFLMANNHFDFESPSKEHIFFKNYSALNLKEVDLSNNKISSYPAVLSEISTMTNVNLKKNFIKTLKLVSLLSSQPSDEINLNINLDSNKISTIQIDPEDLNKIANSKTIVRMTRNPIICDCNAINFAKFIQQDNNLKKYIGFEPSRVECSGLVKGNIETLNKIKLDELTCTLGSNCTTDGRCGCLRRSLDESLIIDCSNRELEEVPELTRSELSKFTQTEVHLEGNRLTRGPGEYDNYSNISKLYLQGNRIKNLTWIPTSAKVLNLSGNALSFINDVTLKLLNTSRIGNLSLGYNPWRCDCEATNFAKFIRGHISQIDSLEIRCNNTGKKLLNLNEKDLCPTNTELILIMSLFFLTLFLVPTIAVSIYLKYKKEILIWLYSRGLCLWLVEEDEIDEDKIYDAFISYSHKDEDFVTDNLISILESGEQPYKLCIHVRDFIPGELIHSQILNSVRASRRTIVILSSSFLESVWGKLEFKTAHTEAMLEGRARVIIIIYGDIDLKSLDDDLKAYIKTNTYVEWGDPWFWKKLRYALPKRNKKGVITSQKHANMMQFINDKFHLMKRESNCNPISTPPIILDPSKIEEQSFTCIA